MADTSTREQSILNRRTVMSHGNVCRRHRIGGLQGYGTQQGGVSPTHFKTSIIFERSAPEDPATSKVRSP